MESTIICEFALYSLIKYTFIKFQVPLVLMVEYLYFLDYGRSKHGRFRYCTCTEAHWSVFPKLQRPSRSLGWAVSQAYNWSVASNGEAISEKSPFTSGKKHNCCPTQLLPSSICSKHANPSQSSCLIVVKLLALSSYHFLSFFLKISSISCWITVYIGRFL